MSAGVLDPILRRSRDRADRLPPRAELERLAARVAAPRSLLTALTGDGISIIAEMKRRSPSGGVLRAHLDPAVAAGEFEAGGATAISVLTEPDSFGGSLDDLERARLATTRPVVRKDFLVDPLQLVEARAAGADAVLLIVRALSTALLRACLEEAAGLGMEALVEVHDEAELEVAVAQGARLIGINNRDLDRLTTDLATTERLAPLVPDDRLVVSESGIRGPADLRRLRACGVQAILVGETLMRAGDARAALAALTEAWEEG
ncbi:MAG: indole-3-glycerol phosphate synthase TrpC [Candidatus Dormibacteria bacterium]